jgi:hypothetical protein
MLVATQLRAWTAGVRMKADCKTLADLAGPELYGLVLRYQITGALPGEVGPDVVARVPTLAEEPQLLAWLLAHYPESRLGQYRRVAQAVCAAWWREGEDEAG